MGNYKEGFLKLNSIATHKNSNFHASLETHFQTLNDNTLVELCSERAEAYSYDDDTNATEMKPMGPT